MAQTYSQSLTGINAGSRYNAGVLDVGDADAAGNALNSIHAAGAQQGVMLRGNQVLCKNPDGSQSWYTIVGVSLVMVPV
jgi:hypothetical protein